MNHKRISRLFLILILLQALHSIEEYIGRLWANFPPATFLCSLISDDLHFGFLVINIGIFAIGFFFWISIIRHWSRGSPVIIWTWIVIELINGIGHPIWSLMQGGYTPGLITAPVLLIVAIIAIKSVSEITASD